MSKSKGGRKTKADSALIRNESCKNVKAEVGKHSMTLNWVYMKILIKHQKNGEKGIFLETFLTELLDGSGAHATQPQEEGQCLILAKIWVLGASGFPSGVPTA